MKKTEVDAKRDQSGRISPRKSYSTPQLIVYGDIAQVTRSVGNKGLADGPSGGNMDKTGTA